MDVLGGNESVTSSVGETHPPQLKPRILLAATGSVAALKFSVLVQSISAWAEVKAICTNSSLHFIDQNAIPSSVKLYTDDDEWSSWKKLGDTVLHIELRKWADALIIAPLSANTLAKVPNIHGFFSFYIFLTKRCRLLGANVIILSHAL